MTNEECKAALKRIAGYMCAKKDLEALTHAMNVLEQEPILDKIREQIKDYLRGVEITLEVLVKNDPLRPKMEGAKDTLEECLELIDRAERDALPSVTPKNQVYPLCEDCRTKMDEVRRAYDNAMKQESILDKLRAEIIENSIEDYKYHGCGTDELIIETSEVLRVLDKYKAETEGT